MTESVLRIERLSKSFGSRKILKDVTFETHAGEVFGLLGPNGAGKTTTIKIAAGLLASDAGQISVCGCDMERQFEKAMAHVGGIVENPEFYNYMSGWANLKQFANMREGVTDERIREVVHLVGLDKRIHDKVKKYSLGMRQRLGVALAILHRPRLLILDEPTNGLDAASIKALRDILKTLAHEQGISVLVSSHLMGEMELMCDRVGLIVKGELRGVYTVRELIAASTPDHAEFVLCVSDAARAAELIGTDEDVTVTLTDDSTLSLTLPCVGCNERLAEYNRRIVTGDVSLFTVSKKENRKLEDAFIELTSPTGGEQID